MKIALDYDGTFTLDPTFWLMFLSISKIYKIDVRFVTMRKPDMPITWPKKLREDYKIPVIYTSNMQKREYCDEIGWQPDIWIDDSPEFIVRRDIGKFLNLFNPDEKS